MEKKEIREIAKSNIKDFIKKISLIVRESLFYFFNVEF